MICAEKLQRLMLAGVLALSWFLISVGSVYGFVLLGFVIAMIVIWAVTDFCPSIWVLSNLVGRCKSAC